jgi:probable rRNA maturation factor
MGTSTKASQPVNLETEIDDEAWNALSGFELLVKKAAAETLSILGIAPQEASLVICLSGDDQVAQLNARWRGKSSATNVLSFPAPADMPVPPGELQPLGDIILAAGVVAREAEQQGKSLHDHTAHLIVHGILHILGYDHICDADAQQMERLEIEILARLGIADPYAGNGVVDQH